MKTALRLAIGFFAAGFALSASAAGFQLPTPKIEKLPNGLTIVWFAGEKLPVVDFSLLVRAGYRDDPAGKSGVSELVAATLDRGAGGMTERQIAREIEKLGASRSATTGDDSFVLGLHGLSIDGERLLEMLSILALKPTFAESEVRKEHTRLKDRWSRLGDYSENLAALAYHRWMAADTVYGRGSFLSMKEFDAVGPTDVVAFHKRHFVPERAVLVLVGRLDEAKTRGWVEKHFGGWAPGGAEAASAAFKYRSPLVPKADERGTVVVVDRPGLTQAQVRIGWHAPAIKSPEHYPLVVGNSILGEFFHSRLNSLIRDKLGLTYGIGSGVTHAMELDTLSISAATQNDQVGKLLVKTREVMKELGSQGVSPEEVAQAREYLRGSFALGTATLGAVASRWLGGYLFGLGPDYLNEFVPRISAIQAPEVSAVFAKGFAFERAAIVVAGDAKLVVPVLKAAGFPKVRVLTAQQFM